MIKNMKNQKEIRFILFVLLLFALLAAVSKFYDLYQLNAMKQSITNLYEHQLKVSDAALTVSKLAKFENDSDTMYHKLVIISIFVGGILLVLFTLIAYYTIRRISNHIHKNNHLNDVLSVIRDVNHLIVREKDRQKLIQECCNILITDHIFGNAWIVLYDGTKCIDYVASADESENFHTFKKQVEAGWIPHCVEMAAHRNKDHVLIENTKVNCPECPLTGIYSSKGAFTIQLKHNEYVYGYMTLSVDARFINDKEELSLLQEVAGDISYALYNFQTEQNLRESEERHRFAVEATNDGIWDWNIITNKVYFSPRWKELLGYRDSEMNNAFEEWESRLHPEDKEKTFLEIKNAQDGKTDMYKGFYRLRHKEGYWVWIEAKGQILRDEHDQAVRMVGSHTDITKEKEHESALVYLQKLYKNIIDSVDNIIFVKDTEFAYIVCNQAFEKFVGKPNNKIIGKSDYDLFDQEIADFFRKHDEIMFAEKKTKSNFEWVTYPDGKEAYLLTVKSPLMDGEGNLLGLVGNSADLTEKKRAEDALEISNDKFEKAFNQTPNMILITHLETGTIYDVNKTFERVSGYTREEVIGKTVLDIRLWDNAKERETFLTLLHENGSVEGNIYTFAIKDGSSIITQVYASYVIINNEKYILAIGDDITEKRDSFEQLEQKKREFETIFQEAPNPIMLHNEEGQILMVNKVWEALTGYRYDEIDTIDKWVDKACSRKKSILKENIENLYCLDKKIDLGESAITTKSGDTIIWQFSSAPLGMIDGKRAVVTSAMDITELKRKDELMMVQSRHAAMGEMIGMIAHQWRQPIAGIAMDANNMLLDIALDTFDGITTEEYAQDILDQTKHLSKTIDDFRNFFKPDKTVSKVKLYEIMDETFSIVKESLVNNKIEYKTTYTSDSEVDAYPRELMQVFVNIINNAKDSLITAQPQKPLIEVNVYDDEQYVNTEICDNGTGIDEAILPKLFDPYFTTKDEMTGTGLGLYMSKMIIEEHLHGIIEVFNYNNGACFRVRLLKKTDSESPADEKIQ